jgi:hypothetical protein
MPDRIQQEIEEILARVGDLPGEGSGQGEPIPLRRRRRRRPRWPSFRLPFEPATLLFAGAGLVVGGLAVSAFWSQAIWLSFAGVVVFLGAFIWSFFREPGQRVPGGPRRVYWRDRYIEYEPERPSVARRIRRWLRRR